MADYRRLSDAAPRRVDRDLSDRAGDEVRAWFVDDAEITWGNQSHVTEREGAPSWTARERGGYWRQYQQHQARYRSNVVERLDGVKDVTSPARITRDSDGHNWTSDSSRASGPDRTSAQPVSEGTGTPSTSTSSTTA